MYAYGSQFRSSSMSFFCINSFCTKSNWLLFSRLSYSIVVFFNSATSGSKHGVSQSIKGPKSAISASFLSSFSQLMDFYLLRCQNLLSILMPMVILTLKANFYLTSILNSASLLFHSKWYTSQQSLQYRMYLSSTALHWYSVMLFICFSNFLFFCFRLFNSNLCFSLFITFFKISILFLFISKNFRIWF